MGSLSLLQWIFLNQELNWGLPHCRQILYQLSHHRSPKWFIKGHHETSKSLSKESCKSGFVKDSMLYALLWADLSPLGQSVQWYSQGSHQHSAQCFRHSWGPYTSVLGELSVRTGFFACICLLLPQGLHPSVRGCIFNFLLRPA